MYCCPTALASHDVNTAAIGSVDDKVVPAAAHQRLVAGDSSELSVKTDHCIDDNELKLADEEEHQDDLESDVIVYSTGPTASSRRWTRPALLIAILAIIVVSIAVGVSSNRANAPNGQVSSSTTLADMEEANQPAPAPVPEAFSPTTPFPTDGGTVTVSFEVTSGSTPSVRYNGTNTIASPTWRG
jgi:hypothetical protein